MPDSNHFAQPHWHGVTPRAWQAAALPLALSAIRDGKRAVVQAIMGSGKSVLIAEVCRAAHGRIVVTVPTVALVDQLAGTIGARLGEGQIGRFYTHAKEADRRVTICCLPSLPQLVALAGFGPPDLWIADEAHRTDGPRTAEAYETLKPTAALGFSATPFLADERDELKLWDEEIYSYGVGQAMKDGVVVPFDVRSWEGANNLPVDEVCTQMIREVLHYGPGLTNAKTTDDADAYALALTARGIAADSVHSKMARPEVAAVMDRLKSGELRCVVHVNMLSEGVDYPWLRWLCLRRPVGSRVRFCQEVGRVLRSHPGKERAILLDPHDLLGSFALSYDAILSGMGEEKGEPMDQELREAMQDDPAQPFEVRLARKLKAWKAYIRRLYYAGLGAGAYDVRVKSTSWRPCEPTPAQIDYAKKLASWMSRDSAVPVDHRRMFAEIAGSGARLRRGDASDLITVLVALNDSRRAGTPLWPKLMTSIASECVK